MTFHSPHIYRERILAYGEPGTGKTRAYFDIAKYLKLTSTATTMHVIDNDKSALLMSESFALPNVSVAEVYEWPEYVRAIKDAVKVAHPDDWIIMDLASEAWSCVQNYYTEQLHGDDPGAYFLKVRQGQASDMEGWTDWQYVNRLYADFIRPLVYKSPCHIFCTSTTDPVMRPNPKKPNSPHDDTETLSVFASVGFRPEGQKRLRHQFNTTAFLHKSSRGDYLYTTVKDRERQLQISHANANFALSYLKEVAGWVID